MYRYIVALLLVTLHSKSSGAPTSASGTDVSDLLKDLANTCENPFLKSQITSKLSDCHVLIPPYDEKKIQCMLFYDINKQLCASEGASILALNKEYTEKIQRDQDVAKLCTVAKDWTFDHLDETYKKYVTAVFTSPIRCARVCSLDNSDIWNVESNFYCKYFKWGTEMLTQTNTAPAQSGTAGGAPVHLPANTDMVNKKPALSPVESSVHSDLGVKVKNSDVIAKPLSAANSAPLVVAAEPALSTPEKAKSESLGIVETAPDLPVLEPHLNNVNPSANSEKSETITNKDNKDVVANENSAVSGDGTQNTQVGQTKSEKKQDIAIETNNISQKLKTEQDDDTKKVDQASNLPNSQVEKSNLNDNADPDDYQNELEDDVKGGLSDNQGGDDGDDGSLGDLDLKADRTKIDINKKSESSLTQINVNDISQKEYYPSDGFSEDDDHFFSFFLTAIIMVVLLYVLYHNKSKVSKVIMGLIVEGRQPGRRRNSRGHAYKRLDTLEQAMSASSAAPPSKIIY